MDKQLVIERLISDGAFEEADAFPLMELSVDDLLMAMGCHHDYDFRCRCGQPCLYDEGRCPGCGAKIPGRWA